MRLAFLALLLLSGCASSADRIVLDPQSAAGAVMWQAAFALHYGQIPVVIQVHGGTENGRWVFHPAKGPALDAESFVAGVAASHPGRDILVVACNEDHHRLHVKHAFYPDDIIWREPGMDLRWLDDDGTYHVWVGDVGELLEGK